MEGWNSIGNPLPMWAFSRANYYLNASSHHPFFPPSLPHSLSVYPREGTADSLAMTRALGDFAYKRKPGLGVEEQMVRKGGREEGKVVACDKFVLTVPPSLPPSLPPSPPSDHPPA